ncbi:transcriptional regulator [Natronobiforma cellulositropha]|uniref:transcriptional regulator n=1 Tax=Natronobiforma cellulositropha TaxID=1679076 RepID=UPI0021D5EF65|nr:transcriptional regulator [Natronobiforma cellulositropha]
MALTLDDHLEAVANVYRREMLLALTDHNPQFDRAALTYGSNQPLEDRQVALEMEHVHLPKLVDMGLIRWNRGEHEVKKGPEFEKIEPLLAVLPGRRNSLVDDQSP